MPDCLRPVPPTCPSEPICSVLLVVDLDELWIPHCLACAQGFVDFEDALTHTWQAPSAAVIVLDEAPLELIT